MTKHQHEQRGKQGPLDRPPCAWLDKDPPRRDEDRDGFGVGLAGEPEDLDRPDAKPRVPGLVHRLRLLTEIPGPENQVPEHRGLGGRLFLVFCEEPDQTVDLAVEPRLILAARFDPRFDANRFRIPSGGPDARPLFDLEAGRGSSRGIRTIRTMT
jgi:hypothetical protein